MGCQLLDKAEPWKVNKEINTVGDRPSAAHCKVGTWQTEATKRPFPSWSQLDRYRLQALVLLVKDRTIYGSVFPRPFISSYVRTSTKDNV